MPSFLQTPDWLAFQKSFGRMVWRLDDGFIQANVIRHDARMGKNYLYVPHGPEIKEGAATRDHIHHFTGHMRKLPREQGSMFIKIEPLQDDIVDLLMRNGMHLKRSNRSIQPAKTVIMDLQKDEDELLSALHHKTRYNMKLAQRKGVSVNELPDINAFWPLMEKTTERDKFHAHPREYYERLLTFFERDGGHIRTRLFAALADGKPVAVAIILEHAGTAYYLHGASDPEYRSLMAPHLLHWELLMRYKGVGFNDYDFWGIDSRRYPGVSRFKLSWGGRVVEHPGSFDVSINKFWHWLWQHICKVQQKVDAVQEL